MKNKAYVETILVRAPHYNIHLQVSQHNEVSTPDIQWLTILIATLDFNGNCVKNEC